MKELKTVLFTNERGNAKPSVQRELKAQVAKHYLSEFERGDNGKYFIPIATDENSGNTIYAVCELVVTANPVLEKKESKKRTVVETVEIPSLFD